MRLEESKRACLKRSTFDDKSSLRYWVDECPLLVADLGHVFGMSLPPHAPIRMLRLVTFAAFDSPLG